VVTSGITIGITSSGQWSSNSELFKLVLVTTGFRHWIPLGFHWITSGYHWITTGYHWASTGVYNWNSTGTPLETPLGWGEGWFSLSRCSARSSLVIPSSLLSLAESGQVCSCGSIIWISQIRFQLLTVARCVFWHLSGSHMLSPTHARWAVCRLLKPQQFTSDSWDSEIRYQQNLTNRQSYFLCRLSYLPYTSVHSIPGSLRETIVRFY
jgi:phosphotransferase system  glucose/maltose/N-acetylglucosamine-specific IIC component